MLDDKLKKLEKSEGVNCDNPNWTEEFHMNEIDNNILDVIMSIVESSYRCIPIVGNDDRIHCKRKKLANYNEEVKPFRTDTIYWHAQWVKEGRVHEGWMYDIMVRKRKDYHRAVNSCLNNANRLKAKAALEKAQNKDSCLIKELKKLYSPSRQNLPDEVDGCYGEDTIVNKFIYNRNESDKDIATFTENNRKICFTEG